MSRASKGFRIAGNLIKFAAAAIVAGVIALLLVRIFSAGTPKELKAMTPNDALVSAYEEYGKELYVFNQDHYPVTTADRNRGYFGITEYYIIPDANQIQLVFRYNNSTIRALAEDYSLEAVPDRNAELYDVSLVVQTDLTPDNDSDNGGNVPEAVSYTRIFPSSVRREQSNLYNYFRYVFEFDSAELSLSELLESGELLAVYADIYYNEDINYDETAYGTLFLYDYETDIVKKKLTSKDRRAIEEYKDTSVD
ncbi:MAG: hypothetical protein IJ011_01645 [Clostridia bacterium]|nr:hypothetical protein [Clostridia bacterium]